MRTTLALIIGLLLITSACTQSAHTTQPTRIKFADSPSFKSSYLISGTIDSATQQALSGFTVLKSTLADGFQNITVHAADPQIADRSFVVLAGQSLYFIESFSADDNPPNGEQNQRDDRVVLVDADGYVVNG